MEVHLGGKLVAGVDSEPVGITGNISIVFCPEEMVFLSFLPSLACARSLGHMDFISLKDMWEKRVWLFNSTIGAVWTGMADSYLICYKSGEQCLGLEPLPWEESLGCIWLSYPRAERGFNHISTLIVPFQKSSEGWGSVSTNVSFLDSDHNCWAIPGKEHWVIASLDSAPPQLFQTFLVLNPKLPAGNGWTKPIKNWSERMDSCFSSCKAGSQKWGHRRGWMIPRIPCCHWVSPPDVLGIIATLPPTTEARTSPHRRGEHVQ